MHITRCVLLLTHNNLLKQKTLHNISDDIDYIFLEFG